MKKQELVSAVAAKTGLSQIDVARVVDAIMDEVKAQESNVQKNDNFPQTRNTASSNFYNDGVMHSNGYGTLEPVDWGDSTHSNIYNDGVMHSNGHNNNGDNIPYSF